MSLDMLSIRTGTINEIFFKDISSVCRVDSRKQDLFQITKVR